MLRLTQTGPLLSFPYPLEMYPAALAMRQAASCRKAARRPVIAKDVGNEVINVVELARTPSGGSLKAGLIALPMTDCYLRAFCASAPAFFSVVRSSDFKPACALVSAAVSLAFVAASVVSGIAPLPSF